MQEVSAVWAEAIDSMGRPVMGVSATNSLPWPKQPIDLAHFREATRGHALIMGRRTFESLPSSMRTAKARWDRPLIVLTADQEFTYATEQLYQGDFWAVNARQINPGALLEMADYVFGKPIAVIGGPSVIEQFRPFYDKLVVTNITSATYEGDVLAPVAAIFDDGYTLSHQLIDHDTLTISTYRRNR